MLNGLKLTVKEFDEFLDMDLPISKEAAKMFVGSLRNWIEAYQEVLSEAWDEGFNAATLYEVEVISRSNQPHRNLPFPKKPVNPYRD